MNKNIIKISRKFWTLSEGKSIGYIESVNKGGIFWKHDQVSFRNTSSNLATGEVVSLSINKDKHDDNNLIKYMNNRVPVIIKYNEQLFSFPWKNNILGGSFIVDIKECKDELLHIKK
jgi:hypothetical protein